MQVPSLFMRNDDRGKVLAGGGAALPAEAQPADVASPTTVRKDKLARTFKLAKLQVSGQLGALYPCARLCRQAGLGPSQVDSNSALL